MNVYVAQFDGVTALGVLPLAAGVVLAAARAAPELAGRACFHTVAVARVQPEQAAARFRHPWVLGLSCYGWNLRYSLEVARLVKRDHPKAIIVLGGPSVPSSPPRIAVFLAEHPWIDVLVLGEGELAFRELLLALAEDDRDLTSVHGLALPARTPAGEPILTTPRQRMVELDELSSPYLDGTFDALLARHAQMSMALVETNRGCPFHCSFCDWGDSTSNRLYDLPMERVRRELDWVGENKLPIVQLVDANFGIRSRDLAIAQYVADLHRRTGFPEQCFMHMTKNARERHLDAYVVLRDAGVGARVALATQDYDPGVLAAVRRSNIDTAKSNHIRRVANERRIPTVNEIILGLPGQTLDSFSDSVVQAVTPFANDSFVLYLCQVLENAEMGSPEYRARYGIQTRKCRSQLNNTAYVEEYEEIVVATSTLSVADWRRAYAFGSFVRAAWSMRLLRSVIAFLRLAWPGGPRDWFDRVMATAREADSSAALGELAATTDRFADSILGGGPSQLPVCETLVVDCSDALAVLALRRRRQFYDELRVVTHEAAAGLDEALVKEIFGYEAFAQPGLDKREPVEATFSRDWLTFERQTVQPDTLPAERPTTLRFVPSSAGAAASEFSVFASASIGATYANRRRYVEHVCEQATDARLSGE